jgi:hypothetical protein
MVNMKRRVVEQATRVLGRFKVALTEGIDIVSKMLHTQFQQVDAISEDEMKLIKIDFVFIFIFILSFTF